MFIGQVFLVGSALVLSQILIRPNLGGGIGELIRYMIEAVVCVYAFLAFADEEDESDHMFWGFLLIACLLYATDAILVRTLTEPGSVSIFFARLVEAVFIVILLTLL